MVETIVIIGREPSVDNVLQAILKDQLPCRVIIYYPSNGFENILHHYKPDLIIAASGHLEYLVKEIKADKKLKHIPVLLLSGFYSLEDSLNTAADDFMSKPINIEILLVKVKRLLTQ